MADGIAITSNAAHLLRFFDALPEFVQTGVKKGLARGLILAEEQVRTGAELKFTGSRGGLLSRLTSFVARGRGNIGIDGQIGFRKTSGFPYELAQEEGAKAKGGKSMAIPVSDEARRLSQVNQSAKDFPRPLFLPRGTHVLAESHGPGGSAVRGGLFEIHYVLVKSIRPRLHFEESVIKSIPAIETEVVDGIGSEL